MFASRLPSRTDPSPLALLTASFRAEARANGTPLFDLTGSNPTRAGIVYPQQEILDAFQDPRALLYTPDPLGLPEAREQIAQREGVTADRVILTASTSEAYSWLFKLLCDPGDEVLVPRPSYPLFEHLAALECVTVKTYPLRYFRGWFVDTHELAARITPRTRAIIAVNPNNPTGSFLKRHEQNEMVILCAAHEIAYISDDVFSVYALAADADRAESITRLSRGPLTFSLNGLSKLAGLPQMKLGWIVAGGDRRLRELAMERLAIIADTFLSVGAPVQYALPALLGVADRVQSQILRRLHANFDWLRDRVRGSLVCALRAEGGWTAILRIPATRTEEEWATALLTEDRVIVQPGYFYDFESDGYLAVSLLTPEADFQMGIDRLLARTAL